MQWGAQFDIEAESISSQFINATGGNSLYCGAMEYRKATTGFFRYQTIGSIKNCKYAISFTSVEIEDLKITSCNIFSNKVSPSYMDVENFTSPPALIFVRKKDLVVENFYFVKNDFGEKGRIASIEYGDSATVELIGCVADIDDEKLWNVENVSTSNCDFRRRDDIQTFPLRQLQLGNCQGDVPPGPMIITSFFTSSMSFSKSGDFSDSEKFSESNKFTKSRSFTPSYNWNQTHYFTPSHTFTHSKNFSASNEFSNSGHFTRSKYFTLSDQFSKSSGFSESLGFTKSGYFTKSIEFKPSDHFTSSLSFLPPTASNVFTRSIEFSQSAIIADKNVIINADDSKKNNKNVIIGASVAAVAALAIIIGLAAFFWLRKKRNMIEMDSANVTKETDSSITVDNNLNNMMQNDDPFAQDFDNELDNVN